MMTPWADNLLVWLQAERGVATAVALGVLLLLGWVTAYRSKRRQVEQIFETVRDAVFGHCEPRVRTGAWGFAVAVEPPPEPFNEFLVNYQAFSWLDLGDMARRLLRGRGKKRLQLAGSLTNGPTTELVWMRGQPPVRALGKRPGSREWVQQRLDIPRTEYALRGNNLGSMRHVFVDLMARFGTSLSLVSVQREQKPDVRMVIEGPLDPASISPLITSVRALGRAAQLD